MKKISANYLYCGNGAPIKNGVVVIDDKGIILDVLNPTIADIDWEEVEHHNGIICPGFVNTHCHLELSYLKGKLSEQTQLHGFVKELMAVRDDSNESDRKIAIELAEQEMMRNGIVAVGDISNGLTSFQQKAKENLQYHTFLEVFGINPDAAKEVLSRVLSLKKEYHNQNRVSITAHAPYSLSKQLISSINRLSETILSIHNQETASENELFLTKSGKLYEQLASFNENIKKWIPTGKNSLPSYLPNFNADKKILLVHNTYTCETDIAFTKKYSDNVYWCFCPNANEFIEGKQPNYDLFLDEKCTIGTDSLASNWSLSVLDEIKTISKSKPTISLEILIKWATFNGAQFLGFDKLGAIQKGKLPGINLIENVDLTTMTLKPDSLVKKLI